MAKNDVPNRPDRDSAKPKRESRRLLHPLHEAAMRIAELGRSKTATSSRDLVAMLLTHGARAWRSSQPPAKIHLHVTSPARSHPVWLHLPKQDSVSL
jgi:hypothetical protein